jgi:hypothetical protein
MEGFLAVCQCCRFPPVAKEELKARIQQAVDECRVRNHTEAKYISESARIAVASDEPTFQSIQPRPRLKALKPWACAYSVATALLGQFGMDITLDVLQIESRGEALPDFDNYLNHRRDSDALRCLLSLAKSSDAEPFRYFPLRRVLLPSSSLGRTESTVK